MKLDVLIDTDLVEHVAEAIFRNSVCDDEQYENIVGEPMKLWKTDAPWDTNPLELAEHERDDYRRMARSALIAIFEKMKTSTSKGNV